MKTVFSRPLLVALLVLLWQPVAPGVAQSQGMLSMFGDRELPGTLLPEQWRRMEDLIRIPLPNINIFRVRPIEEFQSLFQEQGPAFALDLLDLKLEKLQVKIGSFNEFLVKFDRGEGRFTLSRDGLYGHVLTEGSFYSVSGLGGDKLVVEKLPYATNLEPDEDAAEFGPPPPPATNPQCSADTELTILVLASSNVTKDKDALAKKANVELSSIESALQHSGVKGTVRLVDTGIIDFTSTDSIVKDVQTLSQLPTVKEMRRKTGADFVFLITDHKFGAAAKQILAGHDGAFALVSQKNLNHPRYSFAHEFGHLLGASHEASQGAFHKKLTYATAFVPLMGAADQWCDLMAISEDCQRRELVYSNPGEWLKVKPGRDKDNVNNARALAENFAHAAKFNCVQ